MPTESRPLILLLVPGCDPVGTGREIELVAAGFQAAGWNTHVAVTSRGGVVAERLAARGIAVHRVGRRPEVDWAAATNAVRLARRLRPTAVLGFGRSQLPAAALIARVPPRPRVIVRLGRRVSRPLHRWAVGQLDQVLATSPAVAASCPRRANGVQVDVVPPGIESDTGAGLSRQEIAARLGLDPTKTWTLCVAPLVASSKLERLIWAIDQLGVVNKGLEHVLVGAGPLLRRVQRRARVQELAERLVVMPRCDLLPDLIGQVRLIWQSGDVALGGAILDGMVRGVPVVAVESDAAGQLIVNGETGRIVPALPESEFPRRAFGIIEDDALAARYGAAGRERAAAEFSAEKLVAACLAASVAPCGVARS